MKAKLMYGVLKAEQKLGNVVSKALLKKHEGIDGILVTVGLCIIALLLCVVMKDELTDFIESVVAALKTKATTILAS